MTAKDWRELFGWLLPKVGRFALWLAWAAFVMLIVLPALVWIAFGEGNLWLAVFAVVAWSGLMMVAAEAWRRREQR